MDIAEILYIAKTHQVENCLKKKRKMHLKWKNEHPLDTLWGILFNAR